MGPANGNCNVNCQGVSGVMWMGGGRALQADMAAFAAVIRPHAPPIYESIPARLPDKLNLFCVLSWALLLAGAQSPFPPRLRRPWPGRLVQKKQPKISQQLSSFCESSSSGSSSHVCHVHHIHTHFSTFLNALF